MTNKNRKRIKKDSYQTEDQVEVIRFIKILIVLIILVFGVYLLTRLFVTKDLISKDKEEKVTAGEINYGATLIGNMLHKAEKEYYVIIYNTDDINAVYYSSLISNYNRNENHIKIYFADLKNELNKSFITDNDSKVNVNTKDMSKFKVNKIALIKVENGNIEKSFTSEEDIERELEYKQENK